LPLGGSSSVKKLSRVETRQAWLAAWQQVQERARSLKAVA